MQQVTKHISFSGLHPLTGRCLRMNEEYNRLCRLSVLYVLGSYLKIAPGNKGELNTESFLITEVSLDFRPVAFKTGTHVFDMWSTLSNYFVIFP